MGKHGENYINMIYHISREFQYSLQLQYSCYSDKIGIYVKVVAVNKLQHFNTN